MTICLIVNQMRKNQEEARAIGGDKAAKEQVHSDLGFIYGATSGMATGMAVGSVVPIVGTGIGAIVGALVGGVLGGRDKTGMDNLKTAASIPTSILGLGR